MIIFHLFDLGQKIVLRPVQDDRTEKSSVKKVLDTRHFECEAYREVLFRFSPQKTLEQTILNNYTEQINLMTLWNSWGCMEVLFLLKTISFYNFTSTDPRHLRLE